MRETSREPCDASGQVKPEPESDCESGKDTAATSTLSEPEESLPSDVNQLRIHTRNLLTSAAVQGKLVAALSGLPQRRPQGEWKAQDDVEETRKMARDALLSAVADARLTPLLSVEPAEPQVEDMRVALKDLFTGAARQGRLVPTVRQVQTQIMRRTAREALVAAASSGRLDSHLKAMQKQRRLEAARLTAKEALMDAAADGRLYHHLASVQHQKDQEKAASKMKRAVAEPRIEGTDVPSATTCPEKTADKSEALEEKLRVEARDVLALAISNGSLEAVLQEVQQEKKERRAQQEAREAREKLRLRVQGLFSRSVLDGRLATVMQEVREGSSREEEMDALRAQVREVMIKASGEGQLQAELARIKKEDTVEDIVKQAGQSLISAALSGRLRQAVQSVKRPAQEEAEQPGEAEQHEVAKLLSSAAWDGRLAAALSEVKAERQQQQPQNLEHLRAQASEALARAAASGKLGASLGKAQAQHAEEEEEEETKQLLAQARKTLKSAAADGRLLAVFTQLQQRKVQNNLETSRSTARKILCEAATDGRLEEVLSNCPQRSRAPQEETEEVENLRRIAKNTLVQSSLNGELTTVIQRVTSDTASEAIRIKARDALLKALTPGHPGQAEAHEDLRLFAKDVLLQAAEDGRLGKAIDEVQASKAASLRGLCEQATQALQQAAVDGRLSAILQAEPPSPSAAPSEDEKALKEHARLAFAAAAADGRLAEVCKDLREGRLSPASSPKPAAPTQAKQTALKAGLRKSVRETLASSAVDGRLLSALTGQSPKEEASAPTTPHSVRFAPSEPQPAQAPSPLLAERVPTPTPQPGSGREKRQATALKLNLHQIASSSRQKRRIYMDRAQASPSRRSFRQDARAPVADLSVDGDASATRERRLSQGYEALTAVFRSIGDKDNTSQPLRPMSPMGCPSAAPTPPPTSRSSHRSARHRTHLALSSAMAQDLGVNAPSPKNAGQNAKPAPRPLDRAALTASAAALDLGEGLGGERWAGGSRVGTPSCRASRSLGALPGLPTTPFAYSGKTANTVLPPLRGQRQASAAVQWSRQMSRGSQRWAGTQAVF